MAQVSDFLTAQEFADASGIVLTPIARDIDRAIGVLNAREHWNLPAGAVYGTLSVQQKFAVDQEAQLYANAREEIYIDAAVRNVAKVAGRNLVDRLLTGEESIAVVPPSIRMGKVLLDVMEFSRFASYGVDNVYPLVYFRDGDDVVPGGHLDSDGLVDVADTIFPMRRRIVTTLSGEWPADMDLNKPCYFSVWVGVKVTDRDFPLYRQATLAAANAFRGDEESRPYPVQKTILAILGRTVV